MTTVRLATWKHDRDDLLSVRYEVFVTEQGVDPSFEIDEADPTAVHALALGGSGSPVGTARLLPDGRIGRVAVLLSQRRLGIGRQLMELLIAEARKRGDESALLHAQLTSIPFYEELGFEAYGPVFLEADIEHREMTLSLQT